MAVLSSNNYVGSGIEELYGGFYQVVEGSINHGSGSAYTEEIFNSSRGTIYEKSNLETFIQNFSDKLFINAREELINQYDQFSEYYQNLNRDDVLSLSLGPINKILSFRPSAISYELTFDESVLITFKVDKFTFFIDLMFNTDEGEDQVFLSSYLNDDILPNVAGNFQKIYSAISKRLVSKVFEESRFYGLSE